MSRLVPATTSGHSTVQGPSSRDGEQVAGTGARYAATLVERENKSFGNTGNDGKDIGRGRSVGAGAVPMTSMGSRNTGRV